MKTQTMLAALLALPILVTGCNRPPSATSDAGSPDKQAAASTPDKTMNNAPPAAGSPSDNGAPPATSSAGSSSPTSAPAGTEGTQQGGTTKGSY